MLNKYSIFITTNKYTFSEYLELKVNDQENFLRWYDAHLSLNNIDESESYLEVRNLSSIIETFFQVQVSVKMV